MTEKTRRREKKVVHCKFAIAHVVEEINLVTQLVSDY